ncbi:Octicosapeptide/Phox/Bem1p family protein [Forsythia ovata]|uniref:Octicosapeptide/Phox/Bem1p family protein n=1 Tax=Forsythia ovata TaxID=205694 RepID=A0ABD1R2M1_9LAMI
MCSYGGHIIPRPHDKSLCYVGGDTRIVVVERRFSLVDFLSRLSHSLLNGRHFTLKYQLPNEELDSLISVSTDEDLENMIEEYDRTTAATPLKPSRVRLFLFPSKPETATSMGSLLNDTKSETWFVDALNSTGLMPRGLSESAGIDNLLELDGIQKSDSSANLEAQNDNLGVNKQVHSNFSDSPMVDTSSSFGSSSSSTYMSNLPPIKVRIESGNGRSHDQMVVLDEQFSHVSIAPNAAPPTHFGGAATVSSVAGALTSEHLNRVISDDEKSDHGAPTGLRKPPLPLQPVQRKLVDAYNLPSPDSKHAGGYSLPSPDSVASDTSIASAPSLSKHHTIYQDATQLASLENRVPAPVTDHNNTNQDPSSQFPVQQLPDSMSIPTLQLPDSMSIPTLHQNQQQFIHHGTHYIPHPAANPPPLSSYYPMYLPQTQQPLQTDQQYPMYFLPVTQSQPYNLSGVAPSNIADSTIVASTLPLTPPLNPMAPSGATYSENIPSTHPTTAATTISKPDMGSNIYRTTATGGPMLVQVPSHQFHQQYIGLSQIPTPLQSTVTASAATGNYGSEYSHPKNDQVYYAQHPAPPQYHTKTPATAVMLSQVSTQVPTDNSANQIRT